MRYRLRILGMLVAGMTVTPMSAQRLLTLDSCRAMALKNNKQMSISKVKQEVATNTRKAARTKYLPHVTAVGAYEHTSREISILNDDQKTALSNMGTSAATGMSGAMESLSPTLLQLVQQGVITATQLQSFQQIVQESGGQMATALNSWGSEIVDAFRTDTRNIFAATVMVTQPVYMGGMITAANRMADLAEDYAENSADARRQTTIHSIDNTYWLVVSLKNKKRLAEGYLDLVKTLDSDVEKMIREGVATRSEGLSVGVKVNEAEMKVTQAEDGLILAKMLLCQLCGLPMDEDITLADEDVDELSETNVDDMIMTEDSAELYRPELRMLSNAVDMSEQSVKLVRGMYLPHVALTGGYAISNPNVYNGFQKKFGGVWNVGLMVHIPIWNWGEGAYKVRAAKGAAAIASMEFDDVSEKIQLQVNQCRFKVSEAQKKLTMARSNIKKAEENLRSANLGFSEGVVSSTTVMEAQTAWLQAQSQKIDAEIDVKLSQVDLKKALGKI